MATYVDVYNTWVNAGVLLNRCIVAAAKYALTRANDADPAVAEWARTVLDKDGARAEVEAIRWPLALDTKILSNEDKVSDADVQATVEKLLIVYRVPKG